MEVEKQLEKRPPVWSRKIVSRLLAPVAPNRMGRGTKVRTYETLRRVDLTRDGASEMSRMVDPAFAMGVNDRNTSTMASCLTMGVYDV